MLQRAVTGVVAMAIVDRLEVVQVQQQQRERRLVARGQLNFPAQHGRQEAAVEQVGQCIAARIQFADALEQQRHQAADGGQVFADGRQHGQPLWGVIALGAHQAGVDARDQAGHLLGLAAFAEAGTALVGKPQAELGRGQARAFAIAGVAGQGVQQGIFPVQQQCTLALAFGAHVLHQREQAICRIGTR